MKQSRLLIIGVLYSFFLFFSSNSFSKSSCSLPSFYALNKGGFYLGATALYLRPVGIDGDINIEIQNFESESNSLSKMVRFDMDYEWGYAVYLGYDFPCSINYIELKYEHNNNKELVPIDLSNNPTSIASYFFTNLISDTSTLKNFTSEDDIKYQYDLLTLSLGRHYNELIGHLCLHPYVGLRYVKIIHRFHSHADTDVNISTTTTPNFVHLTFDSHIHSLFEGVGPTIGIGSNYDFCHGLGFLAHFTTALMIGNIQSETRLDEVLDNDVLNFKFEVPTTPRIVPLLSGRLGFTYNYSFRNKSNIYIELGYMANTFYHSIDLIRGDVASPFTPGTRQKITETVTHDLDFNGPYIDLIYHL